jgi:hypothetical protein
LIDARSSALSHRIPSESHAHEAESSDPITGRTCAWMCEDRRRDCQTRARELVNREARMLSKRGCSAHGRVATPSGVVPTKKKNSVTTSPGSPRSPNSDSTSVRSFQVAIWSTRRAEAPSFLLGRLVVDQLAPRSLSGEADSSLGELSYVCGVEAVIIVFIRGGAKQVAERTIDFVP